jgi:hypothetical protein
VTNGTTPPPATDGQEGAILAVLEGLQGLDVPALNRVIQAAQDLVKESEA